MTRAIPDFIIAGAARCGTTSLYNLLQQHPQICMSSVKEPMYFLVRRQRRKMIGYNRIGTPEWYASLFDGCDDAALKGEASVAYMWRPESPGMIKAASPDVRLIFMLRDPVARIYSQHLYDQRTVRRPPLAEMLDAGDDRIDHYVTVSRYAVHLRRYYELFDASNILVLLLDELESDPATTMRRTFQFLGVDPSFVPKGLDVAHNRSVVTRSRWVDRTFRGLALPFPKLHKAWRPLTRAMNRVVRRPVTPVVSGDVRSRLLPLLIDDVDELERMLGRSLQSWKQP